MDSQVINNVEPQVKLVPSPSSNSLSSLSQRVSINDSVSDDINYFDIPNAKKGKGSIKQIHNDYHDNQFCMETFSIVYLSLWIDCHQGNIVN